MKTKYLEQLKRDVLLSKVIDDSIDLSLKQQENILHWLVASIISQQLSTAVAKVIHLRFLALYEGKEPKAQEILDTPFEKLRGIGLSNSKTAYIQNVASFDLEYGISAKVLGKMSDEEVMNYLIQIKGVGKWTVEMMLMFALGREDVFSSGDLGIQKAMISLYGLDNSNRKLLEKEMQDIAESWRPFRTYACLYLWRWKDA
jgi:DNA-3-methyladenine glycosylase II